MEKSKKLATIVYCVTMGCYAAYALYVLGQYVKFEIEDIKAMKKLRETSFIEED